jgi:hypothetical protein
MEQHGIKTVGDLRRILDNVADDVSIKFYDCTHEDYATMISIDIDDNPEFLEKYGQVEMVMSFPE